jgi:hypothetical protein
LNLFTLGKIIPQNFLNFFVEKWQNISPENKTKQNKTLTGSPLAIDVWALDNY